MEKKRQLAAIVFTDIVSSTAIMQKDEQEAVIINRRYVEVLKECVAGHDGEILNDFGDGSLCTFNSATDALRCAIELQDKFRQQPKVPLRIGLHVGEIFFENGKVMGDGVNVASRVQSIGVANSILFSAEINSKIKNQREFNAVSLGYFQFKQVDETMEVFALTNEGLTVPLKKNIAGKLAQKPKNKKRNILLSLSASVLLSGLLLFYFYGIHKGNSIRSIAVFPFLNGSSDRENEYLGDGIAQEIISQISRVNSIAVIGWASTLSLKNKDKTLKEKADELGAEAIVSGSVQKVGNRVRISVELTDARTGKRIWGEEYNRQWGDLLNIQVEVAEKIAGSLNTKLTAAEKIELSKRPTDNIEAYEYYKRGRWFWDKRNPAGQDSAESCFKKALDLDPEYALAWNGLADLYVLNMKGLNLFDAMPIASQYVAKALELDSNLSEALATSGLIDCTFDYDWSSGKKFFEKAIRADPNNGYAHVFYSNLLLWVYGDTLAGIKEARKALSLNPLSSTLNWVVARNYFCIKQYDSAYKYSKNTFLMDPGFKNNFSLYSFILVQRKEFEEALQVLEGLQEKGNNVTVDLKGPCLTYVYAALGDKARAKTELEKTLILAPNQSPYHVARAYIALGDFDKAMQYLQLAYEIRDIRMWWIKVDPTMDPLRNMPAFKTLLTKAHLLNL
jgi:adenylate cyclase